MRCPSCADEIPATARFCPFCGHHVGASADADDATVEQAPTAPDATTRIEPDATTRMDRAPVGPTRDCPRCGATNSAQRGSCGRCGADIETGALTHRDTAAEVGAYEDEEAPEQAGGWRWVAIVLLVAALVGAVVGAVIWFGGDDGPPARERAVFDAGVYPEDPSRLEIAGIESSSARVVGDETMGTDHLLDDDRSTAWVADGDVGETLTVRFRGAVWIGAISVWTGHQADEERHARVRRLLIETDDDGTIEVVLADLDGEQSAELPDPVLVRRLVVEVVEVTPDGDGAALSGLEFRGWEARGADRTR